MTTKTRRGGMPCRGLNSSKLPSSLSLHLFLYPATVGSIGWRFSPVLPKVPRWFTYAHRMPDAWSLGQVKAATVCHRSNGWTSIRRLQSISNGTF